MHTSILTPEGDKPWMDLAREGAYLRRAREAVPNVLAVCTSGRHALLNVFISMKKLSEGDPGRAAAAVLTWDWCKNVFVFDEDINVYDPTEILWARRDPGPAAPASVDHQRNHARQLDRSVDGRRAQNLGDDRRCHQAAGPAVLAGVEMSRRSAWRGFSLKISCRAKSCSIFPSIGRLIGRNY